MYYKSVLSYKVKTLVFKICFWKIIEFLYWLASCSEVQWRLRSFIVGRLYCVGLVCVGLEELRYRMRYISVNQSLLYLMQFIPNFTYMLQDATVSNVQYKHLDLIFFNSKLFSLP
jgi:hypothetical protein